MVGYVTILRNRRFVQNMALRRVYGPRFNANAAAGMIPFGKKFMSEFDV